MKQYVYADNAATSKLDNSALEAMLPWLTDEYSNPSQPYSFSRKSKKAVLDARTTIAACIGAKPEEIYFTSGGTESDNWAIKGIAYAHSKNDALITTAFEHHAVLHSAEAIEEQLYPVAYVFPDKNGVIQPSALERIITDETSMVSVMMANNEIGTIQPIGELSEIAHNYGAVFHTDAVQAIGHIPVDVNESGIDLLSASAHKFNGPKGIGFLYIRKGTDIKPYADGGSQERGMRAGTENVASIVGMAAALQHNCAVMDVNQQHVRELETALIEKLSGTRIRYHRNGVAPFLPGLLSLSFPGFNGETILHRMDLMGIAVSTGSACNSVNTEISHVLDAIRLEESLAKGTIRISLGKNNSMDDIEAIVRGLEKIMLS